MPRVELDITAETGGAVGAISRVRSEIEATGRAAQTASTGGAKLSTEFANLGKIAPGAGRSMGMLSGELVNAARGMGATNTQVRLLAVGARMLTGALGPVTIAIGALSAGVILYQRHQERARQEAERFRESQEAAARSVERHRERLAQLTEETQTHARTMRDLQIEIYRTIDAERARAMVSEDIQALMREARLVEISGLEDVARAADEIAFRRARVSEELAGAEDVRHRRLVANQRAFGEVERQRTADAVVFAQARINALQDELAELDAQSEALQRLARLFPQTMERAEESTRRTTRALRDMNRELDKVALFEKQQSLERIAEAQARLNAEIEHSSRLKEREMGALTAVADKEMERLVAERERRDRLFIEEQEGRLDQLAKAKIEEQRLLEEHERMLARMEADREARVTAAASTMAHAIMRASEDGWRAAADATGAQLQFEGLQRALQGAALGFLGDPRAAGLVATGGAMTAAGTGMRALAGRGGQSGVASGTVAPAPAAAAAAPRGPVNINIQEGLVSDAQRTAQRVGDAVRDAQRRGYL